MIALWLWTATDAEAGGTKKIDQAMAAWQSGDADAFGDARAALDKARARAPEDRLLAVLEAELWLAAAEKAWPVDGEPATARALAALEAAPPASLEGETRARAEPLAGRLAGLLVAELTNQVEGKQWDDARASVDRCGRALALAEGAGQRDAERTTTYERLATRVAVQRGDVDDARAHFAALHAASGRWEVALAGKLARKLAEVGSPAEALAFLGPILDAEPTEEALLRGWVEIALQAEQRDQATARLDAVRDTLVGSKSGAMLLGELYALAGQRDPERAAYEALLALEPTHAPANAALARFWLAAARSARAPLDAEDGERPPTAEAKAIRARATSDLDQAEARAKVAADAAPDDAELQRLWKEVLEERLALLPAAGRTAAEKKSADALGEQIAARQARITELEAGEGP